MIWGYRNSHYRLIPEVAQTAWQEENTLEIQIVASETPIDHQINVKWNTTPTG